MDPYCWVIGLAPVDPMIWVQSGGLTDAHELPGFGGGQGSSFCRL
jgi:hypothetical protein